jgi:DNA-binding transcriptional MerR regulator
MWTIDELVERVREALAAEYSGATDGRVRDVPDRRAIRWYTTIGLVDRPLGMRGRTALYGPRHLRQLVAIKRRQAAGRSLSQIQAELTFVSDDDLVVLARVPDELVETAEAPDQTAESRHMRFWSQLPARPVDSPQLFADGLPAAPAPHSPLPPGAAVSGVALGGGATLIVPHDLTDHDRQEIAAAAAPLLDMLESRGLIQGRPA